jgi:hypothetical protein
MRLKSAALFAVGFLFVSFWLHGGARCQTSVASPPPLSVTDQSSPPAARCHWSGLNMWCSNPGPTVKGLPPPPPMAPEVPMYPPPVISATPPSVTAKGSPPPTTKDVSPPVATEDVPPRTATAKRSRPTAKNVSPPVAPEDVPARTATAKGSVRSTAAKNSPPPANDKDAPAPAIGSILPTPGIDNIVPTPRIGKLSPSQEPGPEGFTVGIDDGEESGRPLPIRPRPKQSKVRQKPDIAEGPSAMESLGDQAEVEKLKPYLTICKGC